MKLGIFSDVHANQEALKKVLSFLENEQVDGYIFCGDITGYGPRPEECVQIIRGLKNLICITGNHDLAVVNKKSIEDFNDYAKNALVYSRQKLSIASMQFLLNCPNKVIDGDLTIVHGSPFDPVCEYMLQIEQFLNNQPFLTTPVCFMGHTHYAKIMYRIDDNYPIYQNAVPDEVFKIEDNGVYMINCGSVGQPRDKDTRASFLIYDTKEKTVCYKRVEYNIALVQQEMRENNFHPLLIERLAKGF